MSDRDDCRRWTTAITQLRSRAAKARRAPLAPEIVELIEQSLTLCDAMVRELAGAALQVDHSTLKLDAQTALWAHLFDEMPAACIETDADGVIVGANRAAGVLLNTSVKHLAARLLMHFTEDRDQFGQLLRGLSGENAGQRYALIVRPRERAPVAVEATVMVRNPGDLSSWLWFFTPTEQRTISRHDRPFLTPRPRPPA